MTTAAALVLSLAALAAPHQDAPPGEARVTVTRLGARDDAYVGEPVGVRLVVAFERTFVDERLVPLFRRPLDLPVHVDAPWLDEGTWLDVPPPPDAATATLALGDDAVRAVVAPRDDGRVEYVVERWLVPEAPGVVTLGPTTLSYAHATAFRDDLIAGRVPEDRSDAEVSAEPLDVGVRPRPPSPTPRLDVGATGPLTLDVEASTRAAGLGEAFTLRATLVGSAPLAAFEVPAALTEIDGFHVLGTLVDAPDPRTRVVTIELERVDRRVDAVPPLTVSVFDPTPPAGHRRLSTSPIPLDVVAPAPVVDDAAPSEPRAPLDEAPRWPWALGGVVVGWLLARLGGAGRTSSAPRPARRPSAGKAARSQGGGAEARLLAALSAATGRPRASVAGRDVADELVSLGVAPDVARRASDLAERLTASRYGGAPVPDAERAVDDVVAALDARH